MQQVIADGLVIWPDDCSERRMERPRYKTYWNPETEKPKPVSSWIETANANDREIGEDEAEYDTTILSTGMTQEGGKLLQQILGSKVFAYPKPLSLVRSLVRATTRNEDIILDSFGGTGTTGHAVLGLNSEDQGHRRFILIEMEVDTLSKGEETRYSPLLGAHQGRAVYLLFNGVLGDRRPAGGNVLTHDLAQSLPEHPEGKGPRVVYGEACRLGPKSLEKYRIVFRQIPFELKVD